MTEPPLPFAETAMPTPAFRPSPNLPRGVFHDEDLSRRLYLVPCGMVTGDRAAAAVVAGTAWPIADGPVAFTSAAVVWREDCDVFAAVASFPEVVEWSEGEAGPVARHVAALIHRIGARRRPWAGLDAGRPLVMGIVNATPDSFSDGGDHFHFDYALRHALDMVAAGADIIDVGGESTRPGAAPVSPAEEKRRVLPLVRALAEKGVAVSIDTRHAEVMRAAVAAGARVVNDVTALEGKGALAEVAASGASACLMHMQGEPQTMQANPVYACAPLDILDYLAGRVAACEAAGIPRDRIAVDPGIGFGKTVDHNAQVLANLALFHALGCPVLLGVSRKSFIARISRGEPPKDRLPGTIAATMAGLAQGVQIHRVHDVAETMQAVAVWRAVSQAA
ncbi:MAG: dihydropteroate synthase [Pseudomonadota bacterium]